MPSIPVQVEPVVLGSAYCPTSYQELNLAVMRARWSVDMGSISTFVTREDAPDHTQYPDSIWIKLDGNGAPLRAYKWSEDLSRWISPHPVPPGGELRMWTGTLDELKLYEGDAASSISPVANPSFEGPFWEPVLELSGRIPIGVNDATVGGPDETLPKYALGAINAGTVDNPLGTIRLTDFNNLPQHTHGLGWSDTAEAFGADLSVMAAESQASTLAEIFKLTQGVPAGTFPANSNSLERTNQSGAFTSFTQLNTFTFDATAPRNTAREVLPFDNRVPVRGVYFIRRSTTRLYYSEL